RGHAGLCGVYRTAILAWTAQRSGTEVRTGHQSRKGEVALRGQMGLVGPARGPERRVAGGRHGRVIARGMGRPAAAPLERRGRGAAARLERRVGEDGDSDGPEIGSMSTETERAPLILTPEQEVAVIETIEETEAAPAGSLRLYSPEEFQRWERQTRRIGR